MLTDPAWLDRTRTGIRADPGAAGSPLAMLALRGPIGVRRARRSGVENGYRAMR